MRDEPWAAVEDTMRDCRQQFAERVGGLVRGQPFCRTLERFGLRGEAEFLRVQHATARVAPLDSANGMADSLSFTVQHWSLIAVTLDVHAELQR